MSRRGRKKQRQALAPSNMTNQQLLEKERRLKLQNGKAWAAAFGHNSHSGLLQ